MLLVSGCCFLLLRVPCDPTKWMAPSCRGTYYEIFATTNRGRADYLELRGVSCEDIYNVLKLVMCRVTSTGTRVLLQRGDFSDNHMTLKTIGTLGRKRQNMSQIFTFSSI